jgi:membrane-associated phospholipid phosphatase
VNAAFAIAALLLGPPADRVEPGLSPPPPSLSVTATPSPSVYRLNLAVDIPVTVGGGLTALARVLFKDNVARRSCPCSSAGLNFFDRGTVGNKDSSLANTASDLTTAISIAVPPILDLIDVGWNQALGEDFMIFAETLAVSQTFQQVANFAVARPRPRAYASTDPVYLASSEAYLSFYSGHVATVVSALAAASSTLRLRYGEQVWPWVVTGVVGSSLAVERVLAGSHFPTDVAAGALAGLAIGIAVPWLHARPREQRFSILPTDGGRGLAVATAF